MAKYAILDENNLVTTIALGDESPGDNSVLLEDESSVSPGNYYMPANDTFVETLQGNLFICDENDNIASGSVSFKLVFNNSCQEVSSSYFSITDEDITISDFNIDDNQIITFNLVTGSGYVFKDQGTVLEFNTDLTDDYNHTTTANMLPKFRFLS